MTATRLVSIRARERDINARGRGYDTYALVGLPGSGRLVWADQVIGAEIVGDDYPRTRGFRAAERRGSTLVRLDLPLGTVIVYVTKRTDGRTEHDAVRVPESGGELTTDGKAVRAYTLPAAEVRSRRTESGWITVVDGIEYA